MRLLRRDRSKRRRAQRVPRFIVFGNMRCGSSTFVRALDLQADVRILSEPFNSRYAEHHPGEPDYLALATDERALDEQLEHIYTRYDGVKSLGYQLPWDLSAHMLREPSRHVIFLKRLNILQTVVSGLISQQTGVWHTWDLDGPIEERYAGLRPLSIDFVRGGVADVAEEIEHFESIVRARSGPTLVLTYEELYLAERRRDAMHQAFDFLGLEPPPVDAIAAVTDPSSTKLNSAKTYAMLPNARELDEALGCDETGRLFEERG